MLGKAPTCTQTVPGQRLTDACGILLMGASLLEQGLQTTLLAYPKSDDLGFTHMDSHFGLSAQICSRSSVGGRTQYLQTRSLCSYQKHQDHGTLVDVISVNSCSLPKPAPARQGQAVLGTCGVRDKRC